MEPEMFTDPRFCLFIYKLFKFIPENRSGKKCVRPLISCVDAALRHQINICMYYTFVFFKFVSEGKYLIFGLMLASQIFSKHQSVTLIPLLGGISVYNSALKLSGFQDKLSSSKVNMC